MMSRDLTQKELKEFLIYDPETGLFTNRVTRGRRSKAGELTGCINSKHGYVYIKLKAISFKAHRLAWLYMTGYWPIEQVDHKDRNRVNNRWDNLREATNAQNMLNKGIQTNNSTGHSGVHKRKDNGKYRAFIAKNGKRIWLGTYNNIDEAIAARNEAKKIHHGFS